jgi:hypothetical protein
VPAPAVSIPAQSLFSSLPRFSVAAQFTGVLHPQDIAGNSNSFSTSRDAGAPVNLVPAMERGNQILTPEHGNRTSRPASSQDRLHDAVFAHPIAGFSLTEDDGNAKDIGFELRLGTCCMLYLRPGFDRQTLADVFSAWEGRRC